MATTLFLRDHLLRPLQNADPGTTDPVLDFVGREVQDDDTDFIGRDLVATLWAATTAYAVGDYAQLAAGAEGVVVKAIEAGTSDATVPIAPGYGETVVDGTVTWIQVN